jgi:hypothetical protein
MTSTFLGISGDNWVTGDAEIGIPLPGDKRPMRLSMFANVSARMVGRIVAIAEAAQTGHPGTGSLSQSAQRCQISFSYVHHYVIYNHHA